MHKRTTPKTFTRAKELHRNLTPAEVKLWARLRANRLEGVHFRRHCLRRHQAAIKALSDMGRRARHWQLHFDGLSASIVDFCSPRNKLIIELGGSRHLEQDKYDREHTAYFESKGYRVLRFWNNDVTSNIESALTAIWEAEQEQKARRTRSPGLDRILQNHGK